jgi:hypothetical protein
MAHAGRCTPEVMDPPNEAKPQMRNVADRRNVMRAPKCRRSFVAPNRAFCGSHIDARSPLVHADERASEQMRYGAPIPVLQGLSVRELPPAAI